MRTTHITFDTGAGVNPIRHNLLPRDWEIFKLEDAQLPVLGDASEKRLPLLCAVILRVLLGTYVYVALRSAVPAIIRTVFMNRHVVAIRCIDQRIKFSNGPLVPILARGNGRSREPSPTGLDRKAERPEAGSGRATKLQSPHQLGLPVGIPIRLTRSITLPPFSQTKETVASHRGGLMML